MKTRCLVVMILLAMHTVMAGTLLEFDATSIEEIPNGDAVHVETNRYALKVQLDESAILEQTETRTRIWDFKNRKIYRTVGDRKGHESYSLFSDIGFRVYEFQNRLFLGNALEAGGIEDNPMDRVLMEHLFSLTSEEKTQLKRTESESEVIFAHNEKELLCYSQQGTALPAEQRKRFILYLRYAFGLHPQILAELERNRRIPKTISIHIYNHGLTKTVLKLRSVDKEAKVALPTLKPEILPDSDPVYALAAQVLKTSKADFDHACEAMIGKAITAAKEGRFLDSASLFIGQSLAVGSQELHPEFFTYRDQLVANADVQAMFSALSPQSETEAESALETLTALADKATDGRFALLIFKANTLEPLGRSMEAIEQFQQALTQEPMIVGAWKDLGDLYYNAYMADRAWTCWDAGRSLNAVHPMFEEVNEMEKALLADHPEFFPASD